MVYNSDLFCKKCAQQIIVPEVVQEDLLSIIEGRILLSSGISGKVG